MENATPNATPRKMKFASKESVLAKKDKSSAQTTSVLTPKMTRITAVPATTNALLENFASVALAGHATKPTTNYVRPMQVKSARNYKQIAKIVENVEMLANQDKHAVVVNASIPIQTMTFAEGVQTTKSPNAEKIRPAKTVHVLAPKEKSYVTELVSIFKPMPNIVVPVANHAQQSTQKNPNVTKQFAAEKKATALQFVTANAQIPKPTISTVEAATKLAPMEKYATQAVANLAAQPTSALRT